MRRLNSDIEDIWLLGVGRFRICPAKKIRNQFSPSNLQIASI